MYNLTTILFFSTQDCNTHPILAMDEDVRGNQVGLVKLGNANYIAIGSFFNHSCAPNTCRVNAGDATVLVATRNIAEGEEIADIYSMHYSENATKQGQHDFRIFAFLTVLLRT